MGDPITVQTALGGLNLTVLFSVITICISSLVAAIQIFKKKRDPIEIPGESLHCIQQKKEMERIEKDVTANNGKTEELKTITNNMEKEIALLKQGSDNMNKSMEEMKQNNREVALRLDDLLRQLMDWMND